MSSNINPNTIDASYPVAGQDNSTQGFRDNFAGIKQNFIYAENEINQLQDRAIFKSALPGSGSNPDNNLNGQLLYNAKVQQISLTRPALGTVSGTVTVNWASGHLQTLTLGGAVTLSLINWPSAGTGSAGVATLHVTVTSTAHTLTFPASVSVNNQGMQGLNTATNTITFAATGVYAFTFTSTDGGSTYLVSETNNSLRALNASSELLTSGAAASLAVTTSRFSTSGASTATLAAGVEGQVKVFVMVADSGDMVITVANAGWKTSGSGTVTFNDIGDGCTLQYINAKWYCIGNNGCVFA